MVEYPTFSRTSERAARRAARRRARLAWWRRAAALLVFLALPAGFVWGKGWWRTTTETAPAAAVDAPARAEALRLLDRAVQARHTELPGEAVRLAGDARTTDPDVPGAALFLAEMALREGQAEIAVAMAQQALRQELHSSDAQLILALNTWMQRGKTGAQAAGARATQLLSEAAEAELSNGAVRFFAGDLQRAIGRPAEAHRSLLGGLYRQQVWHSAALLAAKMSLAIEQAGGAGAAALLDIGAECESFAVTAATLARARLDAVDSAASTQLVRAMFSRKHLESLSRDPALLTLVLGNAQGTSVLPFGEINPPASKPQITVDMPWNE